MMFMRNAILICAVLQFSCGYSQEELSSWLVTDSAGAGNMIFASEKIGIGQEGNLQLKTTFILGEPIWGRAYFPKQFREYGAKKKDRFRLDLYVDGQLKQTVYQESPEPHWSQMQIWLYGTGRDYFDSFEELLKDCGQGEHSVKILITVEPDRPSKGSGSVIISSGKLTVIVP